MSSEAFEALETLCQWLDESGLDLDAEVPPSDNEPPFVPDFAELTLQEQADALAYLERMLPKGRLR